jgi:hypothetical protein
MAKSVWYSYVVDAEVVGALEDLGVGGEGHGGIGRGVAITDLIIARGATDLDQDGGDMVRIGEDLIGEVRMEVITTMCLIQPMVLILGTAMDTLIL